MTHYVRWNDPDTKAWMTQKMDSDESAKFLLTLLRAHGYNADAIGRVLRRQLHMAMLEPEPFDGSSPLIATRHCRGPA